MDIHMNQAHLSREKAARRRHVPTVKKRKGRKLLLGLVCFLVVVYYCSAFIGSALVDKSKFAAFEDSLNKESVVSVQQMPAYVEDAFVSIEDHRFNYHLGVDPIAIVRAISKDVMSKGYVQGGSTITMQLAKNNFLTNEKSLERKLKELFIAVHLERIYTKEEIMTAYLNTIYFGHGIYGIDEAAHFYFGKTVKENDPNLETITLSEAAMLAALPKAPEHYSPINDPELAISRQAIVLKRMEKLHKISESERLAATWTTIGEMTTVDRSA